VSVILAGPIASPASIDNILYHYGEIYGGHNLWSIFPCRKFLGN
jgi:hypothetical protein